MAKAKVNAPVNNTGDDYQQNLEMLKQLAQLLACFYVDFKNLKKADVVKVVPMTDKEFKAAEQKLKMLKVKYEALRKHFQDMGKQFAEMGKHLGESFSHMGDHFAQKGKTAKKSSAKKSSAKKAKK
jgi:hypothetical protein